MSYTTPILQGDGGWCDFTYKSYESTLSKMRLLRHVREVEWRVSRGIRTFYAKSGGDCPEGRLQQGSAGPPLSRGRQFSKSLIRMGFRIKTARFCAKSTTTPPSAMCCAVSFACGDDGARPGGGTAQGVPAPVVRLQEQGADPISYRVVVAAIGDCQADTATPEPAGAPFATPSMTSCILRLFSSYCASATFANSACMAEAISYC